MNRASELTRYKVIILYKTGCITQTQLAKLFKMTQQNVARIVGEAK